MFLFYSTSFRGESHYLEVFSFVICVKIISLLIQWSAPDPLSGPSFSYNFPLYWEQFVVQAPHAGIQEQ